MQFFNLALILSCRIACFYVFCTKTFVCFISADSMVFSLPQQAKTLSANLPIIAAVAKFSSKHKLWLAYRKKRRTPSWHPSLSILTSSPFASSGSVSLPQLIRKATHKRTSSKIQPLFLIWISISHHVVISLCAK